MNQRLSPRHREILAHQFSRLSDPPNDVDTATFYWALLKAEAGGYLEELAQANIPNLSLAASVYLCQPKEPAPVIEARRRPDAGNLTWRVSTKSKRVLFMQHPNRHHAIACVTGPNPGGWRLVQYQPTPA